MIITVYNPELDDIERSYLATATALGVTSLVVKNNSGFSGSRALLIGEMGTERAELATSTGVSGATSITGVSTTLFPHNGDDPVYALRFDRAEVFKASSIGGSYSLLATVVIDVNNPDGVTLYDDTTGIATDYYQIKYKNSVTLEESDYSDPIKATGYLPGMLGNVIDQVVRRIRDTDFTVLTIDEYIDIANEVNNDLMGQASKPYRFQKERQTLDVAAGVSVIPLPADFYKFNYATVTDSSGGVTRSRKIWYPLEYEDFYDKYSNSNWAPGDQIYDIAIDDEANTLVVGPTPLNARSGVIVLHYFKTIPVLDSLGDLLITPNNLIYRYKMLAEAYTAKADSDNDFGAQATKYENKYGQEVVKLQRYNRVDEGTPRSMAKHKIPGYRRRYQL